MMGSFFLIFFDFDLLPPLKPTHNYDHNVLLNYSMLFFFHYILAFLLCVQLKKNAIICYHGKPLGKPIKYSLKNVLFCSKIPSLSCISGNNL